MHRLLVEDPSLWLSRSWTTRPRRPGEPEDAYVFVDRERFERRIGEGGFLEWAEVLPGQLSGTPAPHPPPGQDLLLEIDVQGAGQVKALEPSALLVYVVAPSPEEQAERARGRGDPAEAVARRLALADAETAAAKALGAIFVVNDDLERATEEIRQLIATARGAG